jgi:methylthioxylose transferase
VTWQSDSADAPREETLLAAGAGVLPRERRDLAGWLAAALAGLGLTGLAVQGGLQLGTRSAPFLGLYRLALGPASVLAPLVVVTVLLGYQQGTFQQLSRRALLAVSYLGTLVWALALALVDGEAGLTRSLASDSNYLFDIPAVGDHPLTYLRSYLADADRHSIAARGHPPGPVLLLWTLHRLGLTDRFWLGVLVTATGALLTPLVLAAVASVCGENAARSYAPVLILAPYAVWVAVSVDVVGAVLGAGMVCLGVRASRPGRTGAAAAGWALACGVLLGVASLFSYAIPWLGLCVVCLYFARRRAFLNIATGIGTLIPVLAAQAAGFSWFEGLRAARADYAVRVEPSRPALWWSMISLVVLLLAAGPALVASLRKMRNTPGWPFLVGAGVAVAFSLVAGLARGGTEAAWLTFFPWLTVAAVAPERPAGPPVPTPILLTGAGALTAIVVEAILATPW